MSLIAPSTLITQGWTLFKAHWKPLLKMNLWIFAPLVVIVPAATYYTSTLSKNPGSETMPALSPLFLLLALIAYIAVILLAVWVQARLLRASLLIVDGKALPANEASEALSLAPRLFGWSILWGLALIPAYLLFVIPGIWLSVTWTYAPFRLLEGKNPFARGSMPLVQGRWFATFGRLLLPSLMYLVVYFAFSFATTLLTLPLSIAAQINHSSMLSAAASFISLVSSVASIALSILASCYLNLCHALLYRSAEKTVTTHTS